jgi:hypothetical protein
VLEVFRAVSCCVLCCLSVCLFVCLVVRWFLCVCFGVCVVLGLSFVDCCCCLMEDSTITSLRLSHDISAAITTTTTTATATATTSTPVTISPAVLVNLHFLPQKDSAYPTTATATANTYSPRFSFPLLPPFFFLFSTIHQSLSSHSIPLPNNTIPTVITTTISTLPASSGWIASYLLEIPLTRYSEPSLSAAFLCLSRQSAR